MAASELLSDKAIRAALKTATKTGESRKLNDGGGLVLDARPTGAGWWRLRYWIDSREKMLSLGTYPEVSLSTARARRDDARKLIASGTDPSEARKAEKVARRAQEVVKRAIANGDVLPGSFEAVAREWLETMHEPQVSEGHASRSRIRLEKDVFPWIGATPIDEIEAPELLAALRKVEDRGAFETAHRIKVVCGQVFRFGVAAGYCQRDPSADLKDALRPVPSRHHAAITDPAKVGELLRAIAKYNGHPVTRAALALSPMLMLRPGQLRQLEWAWIDFDAAMLTIPAALMKRTKTEKANGAPHVVPLAPQALAAFRDELWPLTGGEDTRYVFPTMYAADRCMSENTVNVALRRMGYGNDDMTAHGFRAMARTMAAERLGIAPEVIEAQLAHTVPDALGRAYNRTKFLEQRRDFMTRWADYLDRLREGAQVVPIDAARAA
jgi:integrase